MPAFIEINGTRHQVADHIGGPNRTHQDFVSLQREMRELVMGGGPGGKTFEVVKIEQPAYLHVNVDAVATAAAWFVDGDDLPEVEQITSDHFRR